MIPAETEETLLNKNSNESVFFRVNSTIMSPAIVLEQAIRGVLHGTQFGISYCIMLLFMYSNGS